MKIMLNQTTNINTSFKSYSEHKVGVAPYRYYTTTRFFREDINWEDFIYMLRTQYKDADKVNIISHACSDGEETYSLALKLLYRLGKNAEKFFPIVGKDFDPLNILFARKSKYSVNPVELSRMENECGLDLYKYFDIIKNPWGIQANTKDAIKEKVYFEKADLLKDVQNIPAKNTVLLTRNVWPYIPPKKQEKLAEELAARLDPSSLIVLGHFDTSNGIIQLLESKGFEQTEIYGILRKKVKQVIKKPVNPEIELIKKYVTQILKTGKI